jgi:DNA replicative helicase MCM subunit Mcm2 (Cdc46/Mcm family)
MCKDTTTETPQTGTFFMQKEKPDVECSVCKVINCYVDYGVEQLNGDVETIRMCEHCGHKKVMSTYKTSSSKSWQMYDIQIPSKETF